MRLYVVFLLITIIYARKSKKLKGVKNTDSSSIVDLVSRANVASAMEGPKSYPVPFGHIFREGFNPNQSDPVDMLELNSIYVKDSERIQELIKSGYKDILPIVKEKKKPIGFLSPKDEVYFGKKEIKEEKDSKDKDDPRQWHDFVGYHRKNINISPEINKMPNLRDLLTARQKYDRKIINTEPKEKYFKKHSFELAKRQNETTVNWTTCAEFMRKSNFHPKDVVNIDWVPFYVWTENEFRATSIPHRFSYPTRNLVKEVMEKYSPYINGTLDWEQPKLVMKETNKNLLIAGDRRGLFTVIPLMNMPQYVPADAVIPNYQIRMKIVNSYLALMICDYHYASIMAVSGNEPKDLNNILAAAATLKFKGTGTPVERDLEQERAAAEMEREFKLKREREKFIDIV